MENNGSRRWGGDRRIERKRRKAVENTGEGYQGRYEDAWSGSKVVWLEGVREIDKSS